MLPQEYLENADNLAKLDSGDKLKNLGPITINKLIELNR